MSAASSAKALPAISSQHPQLRARTHEQVAAVCYRVNGHGIEFLLVQTRSRRWTFPKGCVEPGLTNAQAAALEALEEAGVHGRIEEASFARYIGRKRNGRQSLAPTELAVRAHLCEVSHLGPPKESKRNPTWFPAEKAKRRLRDDRIPNDAAELLRVIDRAAVRIQRLRATSGKPTDALQRVRFEASPQIGFQSWMQSVHFVPDLRELDGGRKKSLPLPRTTRLKLLPKQCAVETGVTPEPDNL